MTKKKIGRGWIIEFEKRFGKKLDANLCHEIAEFISEIEAEWWEFHDKRVGKNNIKPI